MYDAIWPQRQPESNAVLMNVFVQLHAWLAEMTWRAVTVYFHSFHRQPRRLHGFAPSYYGSKQTRPIFFVFFFDMAWFYSQNFSTRGGKLRHSFLSTQNSPPAVTRWRLKPRIATELSIHKHTLPIDTYRAESTQNQVRHNPLLRIRSSLLRHLASPWADARGSLEKEKREPTKLNHGLVEFKLAGRMG